MEEGEIVAQRHGRRASTTNNRMELTAIIEAFRLLPAETAATIWSDSSYCVDMVNKGWIRAWKRRGWKKADGDPVKNQDLVKALDAQVKAHPRVRLCKIRGHSGNRWNEYADALATAWMREEL